MIDITYAESITGWMAPSELTYLATLAESSHLILEVGSWRGRSTSVLAQHTPGIVLAVDTWRGSVEHSPELRGKPVGGVWLEFMANVARFENVWPVPMNSLAAAKVMAGSPLRFDLIFIDASHDYESVVADIQAWQPLLAPGGVLAGHDYMRWSVKNAVRELVPKHRLVPDTSIWSTEGAS